MPIVNPGSKVLVTGANGFVASWLIKQLLEKGYSVRGTVRSIQKDGDYIKDLYKPYGSRIELVEVSDFTKDGAFNEALDGVDTVEHVATPFDLGKEDPRDYIDPAVKGTVGLLSSALKHGNKVKRIVITSSTAAVKPPTFTRRTQLASYSEKDWNVASVEEVKTHGKAASPTAKYSASKTLAETAAWDFYQKHKDKINWELIVIVPAYIFGPIIHRVTSPSTLNMSSKHWWGSVIDPGPESKEHALSPFTWIDVRDLAEAHILALEREEAGGERIIVDAGPFVWQDWIDAAAALKPAPTFARKLPPGYPGHDHVYTLKYDTSKAARIFGIKYRTIEETTRDILTDSAARGW